MDVQKIYQMRKYVLRRDNYTCKKCGLVSVPESYREKAHTFLSRQNMNIDVYDWEYNAPLISTSMLNTNIGSSQESYITWCDQCSLLENIEHFRELKFDCPVHHDDIDKHYSTDCWKKSHDTLIAIWINGYDLSVLKRIAHRENKTGKDLITEAMHDLFDRYGVQFVDSCEHCSKEDGS